MGQITLNGKNKEGTSERKTIEVDFVCNKGYERVYIQSALNLPTAEKQAQEMRPLLSIKDSFKKVLIVGGLQPTYITDDAVLVQNLFDFLMENSTQV